MTLIGGQTVTTPAGDTTVSKNKGNGIKTGSVSIKYKPSLGRGRAGDSDLVSVSPESGYVFWGENRFNSAGEPVYVVIAREENQNGAIVWVMSLVRESDLEGTDFKLSCVTGGDCVQLWQSDIVYTPPSSGEQNHPFKVTVSGFDENKVSFRIQAGMVSNKVLNTTVIEFSTQSIPPYIYFYVRCDGTDNAAWPTAVTAEASPTPKSNANDKGYLLVATYGGLVQQLVSTSVWGERHKYTSPESVRYYYFRV